jgi:N-acylneuraminate cytidylyltransferase
MFNNKKVIAFIPLRNSSKGIPNKNIKDFCGLPLFLIQTSILTHMNIIDKVIISTDIQCINDVYKNNKDQIVDRIEIFDRSPETATDTSTTESAMLDYLNRTELDPDTIFILVQATNPFTRKEDYEKALKMLDNYDSILSVVKMDRFFWKKTNDWSDSVNYDWCNRKRRQEFNNDLYLENGAFYINTVKNILEYKNRIIETIGMYEMPQYSLFEIDNLEDWKLCEILYKEYCL